jgi:predicted aspartyl protease
MLALYKSKIVKIIILFFVANSSYSQNPLTDSDFYKAYEEFPIMNYAKKAFDLDYKICNFLSSSETFDKKMAVVDAFNSPAEMEAGDLFLAYLKNKYNVNEIEKIKNIEDKLILSYLYITSNITLSKQILEDNEKTYSERLSFGVLKFIINSQEQVENDECKVWCDFQKLDNTIYKIKDMRTNALTLLAKSLDKMKNKCSNETLVITKTKRYFSTESLVNRFQLNYENGVYKINLNINKSVSLDFILDSGASVVLIPEDVFSVLVRNGTILKSDILGYQNFTIADGTTSKKPVFRIKSLTIGNITVTDIEATIGELNSDLLLGQSFIQKFKSIKIDNSSNELVIEK